MTTIHTHPSPEPVLKLAGADYELANFISGFSDHRQTGFEASRLLLSKMDGVRTSPRTSLVTTAPSGSVLPSGYDSQDWGRKFLLNGGCAYVDLNHLEICLPEVLDARDHVACTQALFRLAAQAARAADQELPDGFRMELLANNSDGFGNSFGTHLNVLVTRQLWEDLFHRRMQGLLVLATFQASSIIISGQGKVGSENGRGHVPYQLSQRADFLEILSGPQTTFNRPIVNSRDEALCGSPRSGLGDKVARLHVIFYDNNLCQAAQYLKIGTLQLVLAMLETGWLDTDLILDRPVDAVLAFSHDPGLEARAAMMQGPPCTALDLQRRFLDAARRFVESGRCGETVPGSVDILDLWEDTLDQLARRNFQALAGRLDWVLKRTLLDQARQEQNLDWHAPELKHLDHLYSHLDPDRGLYWAMERSGLTEPLVSEDLVCRRMHEAPENTRAWTRAFLLRLIDPDHVEDVDWDHLEVRFPRRGDGGYGFRQLKLELGDPLDHTSELTRARLPRRATLEQMFEALGAVEPRMVSQSYR